MERIFCRNNFSSQDIVNGFSGISSEDRSRIISALTLSPNKGIVTTGSHFSSWYARSAQQAERQCQINDVCDHGFSHNFYVSRNGLAALDIVSGVLGIVDETRLLTDANIVFASFMHDTPAYALATTRFFDREAISHRQRAAEVLERVGMDRDYDQILQRNLPFFLSTFAGDTDRITEKIRRFIGEEEIPAELVFQSIFNFADALDYYREGRVKKNGEVYAQIGAYKENPYFFLADEIEGYDLTVDSDRVYYRIKRKRQTVRVSGVSREIDFPWWYEETREKYGRVWRRANFFAQLLGKEFVIQDEISGQEMNVSKELQNSWFKIL